jgi:biopolymer transport protein ExbB
MKTSTFFAILIIATLAISWAIYQFMLPEFVRDGGPLVISLIMLTLMSLTFVIERLLSLRKSAGRGSTVTFLTNLQERVNAGDIKGAIEECNTRGGSLAGVLAAGLRRYEILNAEGVTDPKVIDDEVRHAIEEATMLEVPILEKNLVALSTIASIATMVGLLGTVIGMIRAFAALAHAGAPDAVQLSLGISEALINTAGGLIAAIIAIVAYNYFTTRVDNFTYGIDEAAASLVQTLTLRHARSVRASNRMAPAATPAA